MCQDHDLKQPGLWDSIPKRTVMDSAYIQN